MSRESLIEILRQCTGPEYVCDSCEYREYHDCQERYMQEAADMLERDGRQISQMEARLMVKEEGKTAYPEPERIGDCEHVIVRDVELKGGARLHRFRDGREAYSAIYFRTAVGTTECVFWPTRSEPGMIKWWNDHAWKAWTN